MFFKLISSFSSIGVTIHLSHVKRAIIRSFNKCNLRNHFDYKLIHPSTHRAVLSILKRTDLPSIVFLMERDSSYHFSEMCGIESGLFENCNAAIADDLVEETKDLKVLEEKDVNEMTLKAENVIIEHLYDERKDNYDAMSNVVEHIEQF